MKGICPACGGHEQLECYVGASECCPECTVHRGSTYADGHVEFWCACGCVFDCVYENGYIEYVIHQGFDFAKFRFSNAPELLPIGPSDVDQEVWDAACRQCGVNPEDEEISVCRLTHDWMGHPKGSLVVVGMTVTGHPFWVQSRLPELSIASSDEFGGVGYIEGKPVVFHGGSHSCPLTEYIPAEEGNRFVDSSGHAVVLADGRWEPSESDEGDDVPTVPHDAPRARLIFKE